MHAFIIETNQIITHLEEAYTKIQTINNPDMALLQNKILVDIKRHITTLKLQLGQDPVATPLPNLHAGPIKKLFGKPVGNTQNNRPADLNKPYHQSSEDVALTELRLKADELYPKFLLTQSDQLLDSVSDIEIRAVAKRAGLPVTETSPDRITVEYIDQIKAAIQQQDLSRSSNDLTNNDLFDEESRESAAYNAFQTTDNKDILEIYSEAEIRAVAVKAGLPFTDMTPAKIDGKVLNQIKGAIKKKADLDALAGNV